MKLSARCIRVAILAFWAVMAAWFVRFEAFPGYFLRVMPGYRSLLSEGLVAMDSWMKITFNDAHIGYAHTWMETNEKEPAARYLLASETSLDMKILGQMHSVLATGQASLDMLHHLQRFSFRVTSGAYTVRILARRTHGDTFSVYVTSPNGRRRVAVTIPDDVVLYSPLTQMSLKKLKPGQEIRIRTINPISLSVASVRVRALREESLQLAGRQRPTTLLSMTYEGVEVLSWIDAEGQILRQEAPAGWLLEACAPEEALASAADIRKQKDLLAAMAVPSEGDIPHPRQCSRMHIRLSGVPLDEATLTSERQSVTGRSEAGIELHVTRPALPPDGLPLAGIPDGYGEFLAASAFVQADDPAIARRARRIVGSRSDSLAAALAIFDWVHTHVRKTPSVSLPSAVDVLRQLEGDCNEHTYLFVALARAAGIPAQIKVGLVYLDGAFYYHAWPAVFVGRWHEMDPTLGQPAVDATHIALVHGEFDEQLKLMKLFGRLKIRVLSSSANQPAESKATAPESRVEGRRSKVTDPASSAPDLRTAASDLRPVTFDLRPPPFNLRGAP
ncbi:MAG: transglutaminase family protein [Kiritimatiellae bacterium]|nr:transglutaminase family protein [Kiritimatiellia bacterium]